jgi:hypothetical protein
MTLHMGDVPLIPLALVLVLVLTVTAILKTLAIVSSRQIEVHDLILKSHALRHQYVQAVMRRRTVGTSVDLIDE